MNIENLREEIFGEKGYARWLKTKWISGEQLARRAQERVQSEMGTTVDCNSVNTYLSRLLDVEYEIYLELEQEAIAKSVEWFLNAEETFQSRYPTLKGLFAELQKHLDDMNTLPQEKLAAIAEPLAQYYKLLAESFAQGRRARAGGSAQYHVEFILNRLGYEGLYERQRTLNGTVDFLFPSMEMWKKDRRRCTVLSVKRTLRERYKQIFEELSATKGLTMYLMSTQPLKDAQKDITKEKVQNISGQNVYLVVRDEVKTVLFKDTASVIGFTDFFCRELPRLKQAWTDAG
ncbi:EcoRII C terminal [Armatimonadetes bacterium DC]|nr:EcoRII C terminal [Armatimonadetes bacterium DC]